ncbi:hypothetical protein [Mycobacterium lepromatosis]|uniref:hypothetical protein n=1 Tax=Mycobacterium lepromatosis TaxID=480418 RepID=UPI000B038258|nr:hypothetical protein [Mycobacterium lepromatosis]
MPISDPIQAKVLDAGIDSLKYKHASYTPGVINEAGKALRTRVSLARGRRVSKAIKRVKSP